MRYVFSPQRHFDEIANWLQTQVELIQEKYDLMIKRRLIEEHQQMEIRSGADSPSQHDVSRGICVIISSY